MATPSKLGIRMSNRSPSVARDKYWSITYVKRLISQLSYANVMATIAVFVALSGTSYAVLRIDSSDIADDSVRGIDIRDRSIKSQDIARNSLTGQNIAEGRLGRVRTAKVADRLSSKGAAALAPRCPRDTAPAVSLCFETAAHQPGTYVEATGSCGAINAGNRRLPTAAELIGFVSAGGDIAPAGELTSNVFESRDTPDRLDVVVIKNRNGDAAFAPAIPLDASGGGSVRLPFRCVTAPRTLP